MCYFGGHSLADRPGHRFFSREGRVRGGCSNLRSQVSLACVSDVKGAVQEPAMLYDIGSATMPKQRRRGLSRLWGALTYQLCLNKGCTSEFGASKRRSCLGGGSALGEDQGLSPGIGAILGRDTSVRRRAPLRERLLSYEKRRSAQPARTERACGRAENAAALLTNAKNSGGKATQDAEL